MQGEFPISKNLKKNSSTRCIWQLPVHHDFQKQLFEATWHGPHPAPRITRKFTLIGPLQGPLAEVEHFQAAARNRL
jgi:hypothetical protein